MRNDSHLYAACNFPAATKSVWDRTGEELSEDSWALLEHVVSGENDDGLGLMVKMTWQSDDYQSFCNLERRLLLIG